MRHAIAAGLGALVTMTTPAATQQPVFRAAIEIVRIDVSVMNGLNPVAGLSRDQFVVTDNGVPQTLDSISLDKVPLNLMMLLDTSGSLAGERLSSLIEAANGLINSLGPEDSASLMTFSEPIRMIVPTTRDRATLGRALAGLVADGATSVNDAIFMALQMRPPNAGDSRPVLLVFSDGHDTSSWLSAAQAIEATKRSGLVVHVIELVQDQWMGGAFGGFQGRPSFFLNELAKAGGGRRWFATNAKDLRDLFGKALNELRARYLLTYSPSGVSRVGWHDVKVTLKSARGEVTARPGYYAAPQ